MRSSSQKWTIRRALALGAFVLAAAACGPDYERTEFSGTVTSEFGGSIDVNRLQVHEGMIVKSHIVAWNDDREPMPLVIRSRAPEIVEAVGVISVDDYAFIGKKVGTTQIEFVADGVLVLIVDAEVLPQPAPP